MRTLCVLIILIAVCPVSAQESKLAFRGYLKDLVSAIHISDTPAFWGNLIHNRNSLTWYADTAWTFRADLRTRVFIGDQVRVPGFGRAVELAANDFTDLSMGTRFGDCGYFHTYFDRLFVQYSSGDFSARLGRQRINWGISTLWNPNDVFNAYAFTDFDYEERPGSDALWVRYNTGPLSGIEFAAKPNGDMREGVAAALFKSHHGTYDLQTLVGYMLRSREIVTGLGWAGNLGNWGFKGEASYFIPTQVAEDAFAMTMAWDYVLRNGMYISFGGLYNARGRTRGGLDDLFGFELSARNLYPFRWTLSATAAWPWSPLVSASCTVVYSIAATHPVFFSPAITWSVARDFDLDVVGQFAFNTGDDGRYVSPVQAGFLRVKWSY